MILNMLANGSNNRNMIMKNSRRKDQFDSKQNTQRRVTFKDSGRLRQQIIYPTTKPKYNFTYGQQSDQVISVPLKAQTINRKLSPAFQTFHNQIPRHSFESHIVFQDDRSRSESIRKKRLKIFPQNYESKQKIQKQKKVEIVEKSINQKDEVKELKGEIQKLKLQIGKLSQSINTSRDFTESQINKNDAERTRRLSELNQFNEKLFSQLAWKLKQISIVEYENYLDQSNTNKQLLESILQSTSKQRLHKSPLQNKSRVHQNFMDIKDFQLQYQQKYNSTGGTQSGIKYEDFIPQNPDSLSNTFESPFLIHQNKIQNDFNFDKFQMTDPNAVKNSQKAQSFTFNKQKIFQQRHFNKHLFHRQNDIFQVKGENKKTRIERKLQRDQTGFRQDNGQLNKRKSYRQNINKTSKKIEDFNRQLENKILRKRINSQYTILNKQKKY